MKTSIKLVCGFVFATIVGFTSYAQETIAIHTECAKDDCLILKGSAGDIKIAKEPVLSVLTSELADVNDTQDTYGMSQIAIRFNDAHAKKLEEITDQNRGRQLHIVIAGEVVMSPVVQSKISGGSFVITAGAGRSNDALINKLPQLKEKLEQRKLDHETTEKNKAMGLVGLVILGVAGSMFFLFRKKKS